jgi:hypothetical protein
MNRLERLGKQAAQMEASMAGPAGPEAGSWALSTGRKIPHTHAVGGRAMIKDQDAAEMDALSARPAG